MSEFKRLCAEEVRVGDRLERLSVDVTATTIVTGALASRDWRPMHHDKDFAENQGVKNIFLNTPNQAAWFERYLTDWSGPLGRVGRLVFKMKDSVVPGDTMVFDGEVTDRTPDPERGICWVDLSVPLTVGGKLVTDCTARIALPLGAGDNPWKLRGDAWNPRG